MPTKRFDIGDKVRCKATFTNQDDNQAADPGGVVFKVKHPVTGVITTYTYGVDAELVRDSTGVYYVNLLPDAAGKWHVRFEGVISGQAAVEGQFVVERSRFAV